MIDDDDDFFECHGDPPPDENPHAVSILQSIESVEPDEYAAYHLSGAFESVRRNSRPRDPSQLLFADDRNTMQEAFVRARVVAVQLTQQPDRRDRDADVGKPS